MGNYSMPGYFQAMPVAPGKAFRPSPENVAELKAIEAEIDARIAEALANGKPDEAMNEKGQFTAMQRIAMLVDEGTWCPLNTLYILRSLPRPLRLLRRLPPLRLLCPPHRSLRRNPLPSPPRNPPPLPQSPLSLPIL